MRILWILSTLLILGLTAFLSLQYYEIQNLLSQGKFLCSPERMLECSAHLSRFAIWNQKPWVLLLGSTQFVCLILFILSFLKSLRSGTRVLSVLAMIGLFVSGIETVLVSQTQESLQTSWFALFTLSALQLFASFKLHSHKRDLPGVPEGLLFVTAALLSFGAFGISHQVMLRWFELSPAFEIVGSSFQSWKDADVHVLNASQGLKMSSDQTDSVMTLVAYVDVVGANSRVFSDRLLDFLKHHPEVRATLRFFPLDGRCNPEFRHRANGNRCDWVFGLTCAEILTSKGLDAYQWMLTRLPENPGDSWPEVTEETARILEVSSEDFKACLAKPETASMITHWISEGRHARLNSVPALFVNGKLVNHPESLALLEKIYQELR